MGGEGARCAPRQGWNAGVPPGTVRCGCQPRRDAWARLNWRVAGTACCYQKCCWEGTAPVAIMATRQEVTQLRAQAQREGWLCPRCGLLVSSHARGYECLDQLTSRIRAIKQLRGVHSPSGGARAPRSRQR